MTNSQYPCHECSGANHGLDSKNSHSGCGGLLPFLWCCCQYGNSHSSITAFVAGGQVGASPLSRCGCPGGSHTGDNFGHSSTIVNGQLVRGWALSGPGGEGRSLASGCRGFILGVDDAHATFYPTHRKKHAG